MITYKIKGSEVALFTDIHWGKNRDSEIKLKSNVDTTKWVQETAIQRGVDSVIFMGDWFDDRNKISVKTYYESYNALKDMSDAGITCYLFVGNHDSYYAESIAVNSLTALSEIENVVIIDEVCDVEFESGKTGRFVPWDAFDKDASKVDVMFGHFEFIGAVFSAGSPFPSKEGSKGTDMVAVAPLVFSGHYHLRKEYDFKGGKVVCIGSPLELDWGDCECPKGMAILDIYDMSYEYVDNPVAPKHIKLLWSDIKAKRNLDKVNQVKGNYVKMVLDCKYEFQIINKFIAALNGKKPIKNCDIDIKYKNSFKSVEEHVDDNESGDIIVSQGTVTERTGLLESVAEYIENLDIEADVDISKDKLLMLFTEYYNTAKKAVGE